MRRPLAIETGTFTGTGAGTQACGGVVPDLPGCFCVDDTLNEAMDNAGEAVEPGLKGAIDDAMAVPEPAPLDEHQRKREFKGWPGGLVTVDVVSLSDRAERISITLPSRVLRRIDQAAKEAGESRSGNASPGVLWLDKSA